MPRVVLVVFRVVAVLRVVAVPRSRSWWEASAAAARKTVAGVASASSCKCSGDAAQADVVGIWSGDGAIVSFGTRGGTSTRAMEAVAVAVGRSSCRGHLLAGLSGGCEPGAARREAATGGGGEP